MRPRTRAILCAAATVAATCLAAPAASAATGSVNVEGGFLQGATPYYGVLVVQGTATCSGASAPAVIEVEAVQLIGHNASGEGFTVVQCDGQPKQWEVRLGPKEADCLVGVEPYCFRAKTGVTYAFADLVVDGVLVDDSSARMPT
ncbi:hypothetical protein [Saccharothrix syringae]|uniref:Uncharacterized protein n=1 Tax=Saccharothrix syringae TaxID=103733 RepID=A0A5Q0GUX7_SACSY|nr:hypothetical protein [Saccharothrix syringae]QFZ17304.1 hypothetical protein EKG83_07305 [Saccharothrix syringae]